MKRTAKRSATRKRRSNPVPIVFANPRKRRRRPAKRRAAPRRRVRKRRRSNPVIRYNRPRRRTRANRGAYGTRRTRSYRRPSRRRRRSNPSGMSIGSLARLGVSGGVGIVMARLVGNLYVRHVAPRVVGAGGEEWRAWLSDVLRIVVMEGAIYMVYRAIDNAKIGVPADRLAFLVGGSAETARTVIGVGMARLSPTFDRGAYGLDGMEEEGAAAYVTPEGELYTYDESVGDYVLEGLVSTDEFGELMAADEFGELMDADEFAGELGDLAPPSAYADNWGVSAY